MKSLGPIVFDTVLPCFLLMLYQPSLGFLMAPHYLNSLRPMVRPHFHPGLHRLPRSHLGPPDALLSSIFRRVLIENKRFQIFLRFVLLQVIVTLSTRLSLIFSHFLTSAAFCFRISTSPHLEPLPDLHGSSSYGSFGWFYGSTTT